MIEALITLLALAWGLIGGFAMGYCYARKEPKTFGLPTDPADRDA